MNRLIVKSKVSSDGILRINVPIGVADADQDVQLTIEPAVGSAPKMEGHSAWIRKVAGKWRGEFERPPQGTLEERDPLS